MFKFDSDARAYLAASNDLMEEIEDRGYAAGLADDVLAVLNTEWAARQAVLDAGPIGNYDEVVYNHRVVAVTALVVGTAIVAGVMVRRAVITRRIAKRQQAWLKHAA